MERKDTSCTACHIVLPWMKAYVHMFSSHKPLCFDCWSFIVNGGGYTTDEYTAR